MLTTAGPTRSTTPITAREYASRRPASSAGVGVAPEVAGGVPPLTRRRRAVATVLAIDEL
jgi:hypothetical protein